MIKESPFTMNFAKIGASDSELQSVIEGMERYSFNEDRGFGFSIESERETTLSAYLVERNRVKLREYDSASNSVVETDNYQTSLIPFEMDFERNLLYVFSNQSDLTKAISRIGEVSRWSFPIDSVTFDLSALYKKLDRSGTMTRLTSVRVRNFRTESGFGGVFTVKSGFKRNISQFVEQENGDITVIRGVIATPANEGKMAFYRSGGIRLYNRVEQEDVFWGAIEDSVNSAIIE